MADPFVTLKAWIEEYQFSWRAKRHDNVVDLMFEGFNLVEGATTGDYLLLIGGTLTGNLSMADGKQVRFYDVGNSNYVGLAAPALTGTQVYLLPDADGTINQALRTDGAGSLSWVDYLLLTGGTLTGTLTTVGRIEAITAVKTANYEAVEDDHNILCDTSGGAFTVTLLASPTAGRVNTVILDTAGNTLTIDGNGKNINGSASATLNQVGGVQFIYNGTQWNII